MDVEAEIRDLKRRVGELEGPFQFLTRQVRDVHRDLLGFQAQTVQRFEKVESDVRAVKDDVRAVKDDVRAVKDEVRAVKDDVRQLREDLPGIVGGAVREAVREPRS